MGALGQIEKKIEGRTAFEALLSSPHIAECFLLCLLYFQLWIVFTTSPVLDEASQTLLPESRDARPTSAPPSCCSSLS